jgi:hypothetical protein
MSAEKAALRLQELFLQAGYIRRYRPAVREARGSDQYKKGFEVRLTLASPEQVPLVARWLRQVGLKPGRAYQKHSRTIQPVYGRTALDWFLRALPREPGRRGFTPRGERTGRRPRAQAARA